MLHDINTAIKSTLVSSLFFIQQWAEIIYPCLSVWVIVCSCFSGTVLLPFSLLSSSWSSASWSSISLTRASAFSLSIRSWVSLREKRPCEYSLKWLCHTYLAMWIRYSNCLFMKLWGVCAWKQSGFVIPTLTPDSQTMVPCPFPFSSVRMCVLLCPHSDCVSFNSVFFRSSISRSCRFSSRQDSSSAFRAGSELLTESYTRADMMNKWERWNIRRQVALVA